MNWALVRKSDLTWYRAADAAFHDASVVLTSAKEVEDLLERASTALVEDRPGLALQLIERARHRVAA